MQQWARPARQTSSPLRIEPVIPRQQPMLFLSLERMQLAPTSVKNPSLVSGIAKAVFSVAMITGAKADSPTPPPITYPSQQAICTALSWDMRQSRVNSLLKKVSLSSTLEPFSNRTLTSPPAQKDFPPAPCIQTAWCWLIVSRWLERSSIMLRLRELSALGRLRVTERSP